MAWLKVLGLAVGLYAVSWVVFSEGVMPAPCNVVVAKQLNYVVGVLLVVGVVLAAISGVKALLNRLGV